MSHSLQCGLQLGEKTEKNKNPRYGKKDFLIRTKKKEKKKDYLDRVQVDLFPLLMNKKAHKTIIRSVSNNSVLTQLGRFKRWVKSTHTVISLLPTTKP